MDKELVIKKIETLKKAHLRLNKYIELDVLNDFQKDGIIQCFEYNFELSWKTLRAVLLYEGFNVSSPRQVIKLAYQEELIANGEMWLKALNSRNLMAHTYNENIAKEARTLIINSYYKLICDLVNKLGSLYE